MTKNMNIEITTEYMRESCRICLNKGEINLFEHQVLIAKKENEDNIEQECVEICAVELFKIFKNFDDNLLSLSDELQLLCYSCLNELENCFTFYQRMYNANKQNQDLYIEVKKIEADQLDNQIIEVFETDASDAIYEEKSSIVKNQNEYFTHKSNDVSEMYKDIIDYTTCSENLKVQKELISNNHNSIENLADEISLLDETSKISTENLTFYNETQDDIQKPIEENVIKSPELKRTRFKEVREKIESLAGPTLPAQGDASLVITQFLPAMAQIERPVSPNASNECEGANSEVQDLNTIDYAAIEIKSSNFEQLIKNEIAFESTTQTSSLNAESLDSDSNDTNQQIFVCKYCPQAFAAAEYLIAHVKKSHVCKYCTQAFVKSMDLFIHIRQVHHQHKCAICNKTLSSHSNLRTHIKRVHGIRLPAQVALLDYKVPNSNATEEKQIDKNKLETDSVDMYL